MTENRNNHAAHHEKTGNTSITQTIALSFKKNRILEAPHKKKTTFLELFFDLAIVFVFTALSGRFADYLGISPKTFIGEEHYIEVSHAEVGLLFWIINFVALWQVWYRYGVLFRNYGNEGIGSHFLTYFLIIAVGIQAISLTVDTEFFSKYGLLLSFAVSKGLLYIFEISVVIAQVRAGKMDKKNLRKILYETLAVLVFAISFVVYVILEREGKVGMTRDGKHFDPTQVWLAVSAIIAITIIAELAITMIFHTQTVQLNEMTIYAHTKERHHLLIIIALGESVLFNLGKGAINDSDIFKMIPDLLLNLALIMLMWFMYKTLVYRASYAKGSKNVMIFGIVHIFMIAGMMLMFSSLEAYSEAQTEFDHLRHIQETLPGHPNFIAIDDIKHAMHVTYPTIYMSGFGVFILSISATYWSMKLGTESYDKALIGKRARVTAIHGVIMAITIILWTMIATGTELKITYIFITLLIILTIEFLLGVYWTNKYMVKFTHSEEEAIEELEKLEK